MASAILSPARAIARAFLSDMGFNAKVEIAKLVLISIAAGLLLSAGIVELTRAVGFPVAAVVFAVVLGSCAAMVHWFGRVRAARLAQRRAIAQARMQADLALASTVARSALPLLPIVAFVAAFTFTRRR